MFILSQLIIIEERDIGAEAFGGFLSHPLLLLLIASLFLVYSVLVLVVQNTTFNVLSVWLSAIVGSICFLLFSAIKGFGGRLAEYPHAMGHSVLAVPIMFLLFTVIATIRCRKPTTLWSHALVGPLPLGISMAAICLLGVYAVVLDRPWWIIANVTRSVFWSVAAFLLTCCILAFIFPRPDRMAGLAVLDNGATDDDE